MFAAVTIRLSVKRRNEKQKTLLCQGMICVPILRNDRHTRVSACAPARGPPLRHSCGSPLRQSCGSAPQQSVYRLSPSLRIRVATPRLRLLRPQRERRGSTRSAIAAAIFLKIKYWTSVLHSVHTSLHCSRGQTRQTLGKKSLAGKHFRASLGVPLGPFYRVF